MTQHSLPRQDDQSDVRGRGPADCLQVCSIKLNVATMHTFWNSQYSSHVLLARFLLASEQTSSITLTQYLSAPLATCDLLGHFYRSAFYSFYTPLFFALHLSSFIKLIFLYLCSPSFSLSVCLSGCLSFWR